MIFRVCFEGDFRIAVGALEVETEDLDAEVGLLVADFHAHVELGADVKVVGTGITTQTHGQHVADHHEFILATSPLDDAVMVKVLGEVLDEDLSFCHLNIL